jgi:hypothetical protein
VLAQAANSILAARRFPVAEHPAPVTPPGPVQPIPADTALPGHLVVTCGVVARRRDRELGQSGVKFWGLTDVGTPGSRSTVMVFFSNRLGCLGSILVSVIGTLVLLVVIGVVRLH